MNQLNTIRLAGNDYPVAPVKFRVLKTLAGIVKRIDYETEAGNQSFAELLSAAINAADPKFTIESFDELAVTYSDIADAMPIVAPLVGLVWGPKSETGEAEAAA